ncbi:MAG: hypothetical protein ACLUTZ_02150 [Oliverpabstia sp.]
MKLQNYFQNPSSLHIGTEPLRAYYVPCSEEAGVTTADMLKASRAIILNGEDWKFKFYESYHQVPEGCTEKTADTTGYDTIPVPSCWQISIRLATQSIPMSALSDLFRSACADDNRVGVYVKEFSLTGRRSDAENSIWN